MVGQSLCLFRNHLEQCSLLLGQCPDFLCCTGIPLQFPDCILIFLQQLIRITLIPAFEHCNSFPAGIDLGKPGTVQIQSVQQIRKLGNNILRFNPDCGHPLCQGGKGRIQRCTVLQLFLRSLELFYGSVRFIQQRQCILHTLCNLLAVEQYLILCLQLFILLGGKLQRPHIPYQCTKIKEPLLLILLCFFQRTKTPCQGLKLPETLLIILQSAVVIAESVQNMQMPFRLQQDLIVVLSVNGDQCVSKLPQGRHSGSTLIDSGHAASIRQDLSGQGNAVLLVGNTQSIQNLPGLCRQICKQCRNHCPLTAGTHQIPGDPLSQHRIDSVNENGFSCTGFTGKHIQLSIKGNGCPGNHRQILNIQFLEHPVTPKSSPSRLPSDQLHSAPYG